MRKGIWKNLIVFLLAFLLSGCKMIGFGETSKSPSLILSEYAGNRITLEMINSAQGVVGFPSTGEQKILVLPVCFQDYSLEKLGLDETEVIANIEKAMFASGEETGWESVSSYYSKSSYGKLNITGTVGEIFVLDKTLREVAYLTSSKRDESYDPTYYVLESALDHFKSAHPDEIGSFDGDGDGYVDAVWLIYLNPYYSDSFQSWYLKTDPSFASTAYSNKVSSLLWAYTYWNYSSKANRSSPTSFSYSWASYFFLFDGGYEKDGVGLVDAHTFIHETGHLFGLDDYYNYDYGSSDRTSPAGAIDMMDNNVGDHNAYSKYLLNWISPKLIKESGTFHLDSFTETGDALLLPLEINTYNDSPFDRYLLFEYYTPTGLNESDSQSPYENGISMPDQSGIRIYLVDARLVLLSYSPICGWINKGYSSEYCNTSERYTLIGASNTPSYSNTPGGERLITLLSSQHAKKGYYYEDRFDGSATSSDLFTEKDVFSLYLSRGSSISFVSSGEGMDVVYSEN